MVHCGHNAHGMQLTIQFHDAIQMHRAIITLHHMPCSAVLNSDKLYVSFPLQVMELLTVIWDEHYYYVW